MKNDINGEEFRRRGRAIKQGREVGKVNTWRKRERGRGEGEEKEKEGSGEVDVLDGKWKSEGEGEWRRSGAWRRRGEWRGRRLRRRRGK